MKTERKRIKTHDRGPPEETITIHTVEQLGPNRYLTANGNLVCKDVPIARVGWLIYGPGEVPVEVDPETGYSRVYRSEETLFSPETIGSFMGVAVTDEHPDDDVTPDNWKKLSHGFSTTNVRRGEGADSDVLLADLIITNQELIDSVNEGKREVSAGYEADYTQTGVGTGEQTNILGNHIALVKKGRCGPRCAIGDHEYQPIRKDSTMTSRVKLSTIEHRAQQRDADRRAKLRQFFRDAEGLLEETADPSMDDSTTETGGTHIHIHTNGTSGQGDPDDGAGGMPNTMSRDDGGAEGDLIEARFQAIEQSLEQLAGSVAQLAEAISGGKPAPAGDADPNDEIVDPPEDETKDSMPENLDDEEEGGTKGVKTGDSAALATGFQKLMSEVEILVPGFRMPTFDSAAKRAKTIDQMCNVRRQALSSCYSTVAGKQLVDSVSGSDNLDLSSLSCAKVAQVFTASVGAKRLMNNRSNTSDGVANPEQGAHGAANQSIASWNKANAEFWAKQGITA